MTSEENTQTITTNNDISNFNINLKERIEWATNKPQPVVKQEGITIAKQKKEAQENEKKWGNKKYSTQYCH